jgi:hypothetical protein
MGGCLLGPPHQPVQVGKPKLPTTIYIIVGLNPVYRFLVVARVLINRIFPVSQIGAVPGSLGQYLPHLLKIA